MKKVTHFQNLYIIYIIYVNKNVSPTEYVYKEVDHTPYWSFRSVVNRDVMDAVDAGQVDPPGGGTGTSWHDTLSPIPSEVRPVSIYSVTGVILVKSRIRGVVLVCWFIQGNVNLKKEETLHRHLCYRFYIAHLWLSRVNNNQLCVTTSYNNARWLLNDTGFFVKIKVVTTEYVNIYIICEIHFSLVGKGIFYLHCWWVVNKSARTILYAS